MAIRLNDPDDKIANIEKSGSGYRLHKVSGYGHLHTANSNMTYKKNGERRENINFNKSSPFDNNDNEYCRLNISNQNRH